MESPRRLCGPARIFPLLTRVAGACAFGWASHLSRLRQRRWAEAHLCDVFSLTGGGPSPWTLSCVVAPVSRRSRGRRILPTLVFGSESRNSMYLGSL